ncbi:unnamed protein product [Ceutorhynchus assimilis]|uniref:CFAP65 eight Ig-like domain-containing protein n=1 Tax=Ceutorhynchus assimilis TaxID=467358 RepID=A0A9N9MIT0_9CUCU|nr:unnamed protein product [Ceutorhynchus assimilis]
MDPSPQIPTITTVNDYNTICLIRKSFGDKGESFPEDISNNLRIYTAKDPLGLRPTADNVFAIYQYLGEENEILNNIELDTIRQHGDFLYSKSTMLKDKSEFMREMIKLRSCDIFSRIYYPDKLRYGLIEKCDLYPDDLRQFLDFRFNSSFHECEKCFSTKQFKGRAPQIKQLNSFVHKTQKKNAFGLIFEPSKIIFKNFEQNQQYKQTVKIKNTSATMQKVSVKTYPKSPVFKILIDESQRIAPGMYTSFTIKFTPQFSTYLKDKVLFVSRKGEIIELTIKCYKEPPKLWAYINKSSSFPINENIRGSRPFSMQRQLAINDTIDCGTCFATDYTLISLILLNRGNKAKFFWLSEEDFYFQDINTLSNNNEYYKDCFWIYPTYFEMFPNEICEINIIFQPLYCGVYTETLYLMCDNNLYTQVELVGDAVCFNKNLIGVKIPCYVDELEKKDGHCIFMGHLVYDEISQFTLSILNKSAMFLKFELRLDIKDEKFSMYEWFKISNEPPSHLTPYSATDILFEAHSPSDILQGYYNAKLRIFINNIPIASLEANEIFLVNTHKQELKSIAENVQKVDVLIAEMEIACCINSIGKPNIEESLIECEKCGKVNCLCEACKENLIMADLEFNQPLMEFGILPIGTDIEKDFFIINRGEKDANWTMIELKYNLDYPPHVEILKEKNLSCTNGTLQPHKKQRLNYTIIKKNPARYVSILVLCLVQDNVPTINNPSKWNFIAQDICVITYEVIHMDIAFKTQSKQAILCPLQLLYTEVPTEVSFRLKNYSLIPGCFYFLKPIGQDANKISIEYLPELGELKANGSKKIALRLTCKEVGILEDIFIPCFIGKNQEPIRLRLLCVVDCVHVFFYLPSKNNEYQKILWPPKMVYEHDMTWSDHCFCEESSSVPLKIIQSDSEMKLEEQSNDTLKNISRSSINTDTDDILETLESVDSDIFLQDYVMEVKGVKTKEPRKFTIFFENVTKKSAKYSVQTTNYLAKEWKNCPGPKHIKAEDFWEPMIDHSGIVIQPETESSYMKANELVTVDIWIYAKTWGIYVDEIIIDIKDIIPFSFSLIIEVTGCPLELPFGIGAITQYPTIRFGSVTSASEDILREVILKNVSSVDVSISWHIYHYPNGEEFNCNTPFNFVLDMTPKEDFFKLSFTDRFFGIEAIQFIEVQPSKLEITSDNQTKLLIVFKPKLVRTTGNPIKCFILGQIFTNDIDTIKSSYFYRKPSTVIIEVTATVEEPRLLVEIEDNLLSVFANDVVFGTQKDFSIKCIIRNPTLSQITAKIDASDTFFCENDIELGPRQCKEIRLTCNLTYEKILRWANIVYESEKEIHPSQNQSTEVINLGLMSDPFLPKASISDAQVVDKVNKILTFHKKIYISYPHGNTETMPIKLMLNYPNISVKPLHIKFGYILVGNTQKTTIIISNLTACPVKFEIFKSCCTHELVVTPSFGEIGKSTGTNKSFQHVTVYFTPTQCKMFHESIRIATNIPQYFVDISVKGAASFNEKFDIQ